MIDQSEYPIFEKGLIKLGNNQKKEAKIVKDFEEFKKI